MQRRPLRAWGRAVRTAWAGDVWPPGGACAVDVLVVLAALTFYPLIKAYSLGQVQAWLNLLFATVMLAWMYGARGVAGAALGLMCLVKPTYALLFLWGALATTVPLVLGMFVAKYLFKFHDALTLGIVSGARTTTASLGLVCDSAKSQIPALGYTVTYAVGNTLLTIWGMVIIMLLS